MIAAALIAAIVTVSASADNRYRISEREAREIGYRKGYQYGVREGRYDRRMRNKFDYKRNRAYKDGKYGYRDEYRHDGNYRDGFRQGFANGYREGYSRNGGWYRWEDDRWDRRDDDWRRRNDDDWDRNGRRYSNWR
jgi:flagellar biosynthesis/type III secretory pathway protein FliH